METTYELKMTPQQRGSKNALYRNGVRAWTDADTRPPKPTCTFGLDEASQR